MSNDAIMRAVSELAIEPRSKFWGAVTYCVIDAVWSINANYDTVVAPLVKRIAADHGDVNPVVSEAEWKVGADPYPLDLFLQRFEESHLIRLGNAQRTSTRNGITKAAAVLAYARALQSAGVNTKADVNELFADEGRFEALNEVLRLIPGEGVNAVRRGYLWMLLADDDRIKPDRMVMRWLVRNGFQGSVEDARKLMSDIASKLSSSRGSKITPWMIDHAIWLRERGNRR